MNRVFVITTANNVARLGNDGKGEVAFTVTNSAARPLRGQLRVKPMDATQAEWLSITGETERDFSPNATQQVAVKISAPRETPAGKYSFRLDAVSVINPDEDYAEGPTVAFEVSATEQPKKPFPWWIIVVAVAAVLVVAIAVWLLMPGKVTVPPVVGKPIDQARKELEEAKLKVETTDRPSASASPNHVISQSPEADEKVEKDSIVKLVVAKPPREPAIFFDFLTRAPSATWTSRGGANILPWNGSEGDPRGFALMRVNAMLEDGITYQGQTLETHPEWVDFGHINGDFILPGPIQEGDRFKSQVGFLGGSVVGEVAFVVAAWTDSPLNLLVVHRENDLSSDRKLRSIDVDLSPVAGRKVIRLSVEAGQSSGQDWAVWVGARIER